MSDQNISNESAVRRQKLQRIRDLGINPYPSKFHKNHDISGLLETGKDAKDLRDIEALQDDPQDQFQIAGRVMLLRSFGKLVFGKIKDESGEIQFALSKTFCQILNDLDEPNSELGETTAFKFFEKLVDRGDFVGLRGELFYTHKGELTLFVREFKLLTKSLLPLPEKWQGLKDEETRFRKRYLDMLFNPEVSGMVRRKHLYNTAMREFLISRGFIEVETPVLEITTGGGDARPFATHHWAYDIEVFLRISAGELWQKRLMAGGFEKTFEIGRIFRNEGVSPEHAQDYSQMEIYWAYANFKDQIDLMRDMYLHILDTVYGKRVFEIRGHTVNFDDEWEIISYPDFIKEKTGIDIFESTDDEIEAKLKEMKIPYEDNNRARMIDYLWKSFRKNIAGPAVLTNEPKFMSPLSKSSPENPEITERFHFLIAGSEVGNGYSELNDPIDQAERFQEQQDLRDAGDDEAQMADWEFVEMLEHGMPPTTGFGVSERLFSFLEDKPIREIQLFPLMKPDSDNQGPKKIPQTMISVALLNEEIQFEPWEKMNTIAHLSAAVGARTEKPLFYQDEILTKDSKPIKLNTTHAIMIKSIPNAEAIRSLLSEASEVGIEVAEFTREMLQTSDDEKVIKGTLEKNHEDIEYLGIQLFGKKSEVERLTKKFPLYSE